MTDYSHNRRTATDLDTYTTSGRYGGRNIQKAFSLLKII